MVWSLHALSCSGFGFHFWFPTCPLGLRGQGLFVTGSSLTLNHGTWEIGIYIAYMDAEKERTERNIYSRAVPTVITFPVLMVSKACRTQIRIVAKDEEISAVDLHSGGSFGFDRFCIGGCS